MSRIFSSVRSGIEVFEDGLSITTPDGVDRVMLENVIGVDAYKRDEFIVDRVCCDIVTGSQSGPMVRTINEDMTGFHEAMAKLEELPGFYRYWREVVILPPFVRNFTMLYREGHDFSERDAANPPRDQYDAECSNDVVEAPSSGKAKF